MKDLHYDNTNGSLYLFANQHELNAYEFDVIKRICSALPCPECAQDATHYLAKVKLHELKSKNDDLKSKKGDLKGKKGPMKLMFVDIKEAI